MLTRKQWGARDPKETPQAISIKARTGFCTHYDGGTPVILKTLADVIAQVRKDQNYHMDGQGWNDIGYNYLVISAAGYDIDGLIVEARGRDVIGAHCEGHNTPWIGVQVAIGGDQAPSAKALTSVRSLYDSASAAHGSPLGMFGHKDGFNTACPGTQLYAWVKAGMPAAAAKEWDEMATQQEVTDAVIAALKTDGLVSSPAKSNPTVAVVTGIGNAGAWALQARDQVSALTVQVAALSAAVQTLATSKGADADAITKAVVDKIAALDFSINAG